MVLLYEGKNVTRISVTKATNVRQILSEANTKYKPALQRFLSRCYV